MDEEEYQNKNDIVVQKVAKPYWDSVIPESPMDSVNNLHPYRLEQMEKNELDPTTVMSRLLHQVKEMLEPHGLETPSKQMLIHPIINEISDRNTPAESPAITIFVGLMG